MGSSGGSYLPHELTVLANDRGCVSECPAPVGTLVTDWHERGFYWCGRGTGNEVTSQDEWQGGFLLYKNPDRREVRRKMEKPKIRPVKWHGLTTTTTTKKHSFHHKCVKRTV